MVFHLRRIGVGHTINNVVLFLTLHPFHRIDEDGLRYFRAGLFQQRPSDFADLCPVGTHDADLADWHTVVQQVGHYVGGEVGLIWGTAEFDSLGRSPYEVGLIWGTAE